jgi:hypothetical protein
LAAIATAVFAVDLHAQAPKKGRGGGGRPGGGFGVFGGGGGFGGDPISLVSTPGVRKELEIEESQQTEISELRTEMNRELDDARRKVAAKYNEKLNKLLLPHQAERLQQISIQLRGTAALSDAEVAKKLGLSDSQVSDIAEKRKEGEAKIREEFGGGAGGGGDFRERMEKVQKMREELDTDIVGVLSASQKEAFEKLKGKPINRQELFGGGRKQPDTE